MQTTNTVQIQQKLCKGCGVCVAFCPRSALSLQEGKAVFSDSAACVGCGLCELRCPDFAIRVYKEENPHA